MSRWERLRWRFRRKPRTKQQALADLRLHYRAMGLPVDEWDDEELERRVLAGMKAIQEGMRKAYVTLAEAQASMAKAAGAFQCAVNASDRRP